MDDNSLSEYVLNFKILYDFVQTMHMNVSTTLGCIGLCMTGSIVIVVIVNPLCWHLNG